MSTCEQQLVEITRALSLNSRVLIMDEPTAALSQREVERLFAVVAELRTHGVAMLGARITDTSDEEMVR